MATIRGKWQFYGHKLHAKHYGKVLRGMRCHNFLKDDWFKAKRSIFVKTIFFSQFLPYLHWKKCSFVTELHFLVLRLKKDFKTFSKVKLPENYTHGRIFDKKITLKRLKMQNLAKTLNFWPKIAKFRTFLKMGPTNEFQTKFSGFSIQFGYRNCKNLKRVLQLNWNIDVVYCAVLK